MKTPTKIARAIRLKSSIPFSDSLNTFVCNEFDKLPFKVEFVDCEPYTGFDDMVKQFEESKVLKVSKLHSELTIFGDPEVNWKFRAFHDFLHIVHGLDFTFESELLVNYEQTKIAFEAGLSKFDIQLLNIETAGQIVYFKKYGEFPKDQRKFCIDELLNR